MYPPVGTSHGQVWYYFEQDDLWSDVPPKAVTRQCYDFGQADLWSHVPPPKDQALGQVDIWSVFWSCWPVIRCAPKRHLVAKCDTTSGHCSEKPHFFLI